MFKREIIGKMEEWKTSPHRKPLILRGARQVGKTTVVNQFGESFDNYLYFNMEDPTNTALFEMEIPLTQLVDLLFASKGLARKEGTTLIFIDEIQNSPKTIARLRYFYEQLPEIYVIAAGSLLENVVDIKSSFPVGRVQFLAMRPCSFFEFLSAAGQDHLKQMLLMQPAAATALHQSLMYWFNQYVLVGGMPEAVQHYAETRDLFSLDDVYESLVQSYKDDTEKYVKGKKLTEVVRFILSYGWSHAGEIITLSDFSGSGYKGKEVGEAFRLLQKAMLLELVYPISSTNLPAIPQLKRRPKLLWFDTGLVNYQAGIRTQIIGSHEMVDTWRGHIAEQITAQELLALDTRVSAHRAFWARPNNGAEVDFVIQHAGQIIPVEVKSGTNARLRSLQIFMDLSETNIAVRVWSNPYSVDTLTTPNGKPYQLINLPFYMIECIYDIINTNLVHRSSTATQE